MQTGYITLEVIEAVAAGTAGAVQINAVQALHNIYMIGDLIVGNQRLAELFQLHIFAVVLTDRHRGIDHLRNDHHSLLDLGFQLGFQSFQLFHLLTHGSGTGLYFLSLVLLALSHQAADLLGERVAFTAQAVCLGLCLTVLLVEFQHLIHQNELLVLELLLDVLLDCVRICSDELDIQHFCVPPWIIFSKCSLFRDQEK